MLVPELLKAAHEAASENRGADARPYVGINHQ